MLILLPLIGYFAILLILLLSHKNWDLRLHVLRAAILWAVITVFVLEGLSLVNAISKPVLSVTWIVIDAIALIWLYQRKQGSRTNIVSRVSLPKDWFVRFSIVLVGAIGLLTLAVALIAPPNTWDSLTTHMSRVAHWAQSQSLEHFATGIELQNLTSPGASVLVLQGYVISGSDRFANLVDWSAMVISLLGVSLIAKRLGASRTGQALAAVFVVTLPMGIAQASSTMTDYVVAIWMVCVAVEALGLRSSGNHTLRAGYLGAAVGLGILTKPTAFAYLLPFAAYLVIMIFRKFNSTRLMKDSVVVIVCVIAINSGYFLRNYFHYGNPIGPEERIAIHSNEVMDWKVAISNVLRNASLHAGTPWSQVNQQLYLALAKVHAKLDLSMTDPRTSIHPHFQVYEPLTDENRAGNPVHAVLFVISVPFLIQRARSNRLIGIYGLVVVLGFVILSIMIKFSIFASRYHLPFFVLGAPLVGVWLGDFRWRIVPWIVAGLLAVSSWSWLVGINNRPLSPSKEDQASILTSSREELYLPGREGAAYSAIANSINATQCSKVGIMISGSSPEYPFWVLLGAPREDLEIEWIIGDSAPSAEYMKPDFQPCAVICERCPEDWQTVRDLPLYQEQARFRLYLGTR